MGKKNYGKVLPIGIITLSLIILFLPHLLRLSSGNEQLVGSKTYYHLLKTSDENIENDELVIGSRPAEFNPYYIFIRKLSAFIPLLLLARYLPILFGVLSVFLLYLILRKHGIGVIQANLSVLIFVLSPTFIFVFTTFEPLSFLFLTSLIGFFLLVHGKKWSFYMSLPFFLAIPLFGKLESLTLVILLLIYSFLKKENAKQIAIIITLILLVFLLIQVPFYSTYGYPEKAEISSKGLLTNYVSEFGSIYGFSSFSIIIALGGFVVLWSRKNKNILPYLLILIIFISSLFFEETRLYVSILYSLFGGFCLVTLVRYKWELEIVKIFTFILIFCGLIFSTTIFIQRLSLAEPSQGVYDSLVWLRANTNDNDVVFSHYSNGFFIESIAGRKVILDEKFDYTPNINERLRNSKTIFYSRNLEATKQALQKYNISYIWINDKMKNGLVWRKSDEGLLFLFSNRRTFINVYNESGIEIWKVLELTQNLNKKQGKPVLQK
ncbi:hypothetical protein D6745_02015 [Candidatus Woesearchaeota archaeon]|nr:MAG: hypothetical protein D6745_02015 [Candidatus Woesearchaeota archaeon]